MHRSDKPEDGVSQARRWLTLAKLVATTLAALAAFAKAVGWL